MKAIIITGLSGAGKTQAMDCLEDMGYYCIDNMPPALIKSFIDLTASGKGIDKAAFVIDVRGGKLFEDLKDSLEELRRDGIEFKILYLEASDRTLIRRYNESRRSHPLSEGGTVSAGLKKEREMLELLRNNADYIIDTSNMKTAQLWAEIKHLVTSGENKKTFMFNVMSFGYKKGIPLAADMVFAFYPQSVLCKIASSTDGKQCQGKSVRAEARSDAGFSQQDTGDDPYAGTVLYEGRQVQSDYLHWLHRRTSSLGGGSQRALQKAEGGRLPDDVGT